MPVNRLRSPPFLDPRDPAFDALVGRLAALDRGTLVARLQAEIAWLSAEQASTDPLPDPGTEARERLDRWCRARSRRVAALARALDVAGGPRPPNQWGESPCERVRGSR